MSRRGGALVAMFATVLAACSSAAIGTGDGGGGSSGSSGSGSAAAGFPGSRARAIVDAWITAEPGAACSDLDPFLTVGSFEPSPIPLDNGSMIDGEAVNVRCAVIPAGGGFTVSAEVSRGAANDPRRVLKIRESFTKSSGSNRVGGSFGWLATKPRYTEISPEACTLSFAPPLHAIAPGRVWAQLACAMDDCSLQAQIRLENCAQE